MPSAIELFISHPESSSLSHALVYSGRKLLGFTVGKIGIGGWEERSGKCVSRIVVERGKLLGRYIM